ncbi:MAG: hypothetical protein R3F60_28305 [bacterium]
MRRAATEELIQRVLRDDYLALGVIHYQMTEEIGPSSQCRMVITLRHQNGPPRDVTIEGEGVGFVDAAFHGLMGHYAKEFRSLETIRFTGFEVHGQMHTSSQHGLDAEGEVRLTVNNSEGRAFQFSQKGRSTVAVTLQVVVQAIEYFVNSERAFIRVHRALVDARQRDRADLIQTYTAQLAELVNTTSYTDVIEQIRREAL